MHISLIAARAGNNVIGRGPDIPWKAAGEQLLFKALTYNQWLLLGRKTYEPIAHLPDRSFAVLSTNPPDKPAGNAVFFRSYDEAFAGLKERTGHVMVAGGGRVFADLIHRADSIHLSTLKLDVEGDVLFPGIPKDFKEVYYQDFVSNINWRYSLYIREETLV